MKTVATGDARSETREQDPKPANGVVSDNVSEALKPFQTWLVSYQSAPVAAKAALVKQGIELALSRRETMSRLIEEDPRRALENALPSNVVKELPGAISENLEQLVEGMGTFKVFAAKAPEGAVKPISRYVSMKGKRYSAFVYGDRDGQQSTQNAEAVHGIAIGDKLAVHESPLRVLKADEKLDPNMPLGNPSLKCPISGKLIASTLEEASQNGIRVIAGNRAFVLCSARHVTDLAKRMTARAGESKTLSPMGNKSLIAYIVDFSDKPGTPLADPQAHYNEVDRLYQDMSYGATRIQPIVITPLIRMPSPMATYQDLEKQGGYMGSDKLLKDARDAAKAMGFPHETFDLDEIYFGQLKLGYGGLGAVGAKGSWNQAASAVTSAHELGHNFGLGHGASLVTTDGNPISAAGKRSEYGDVFEIMGGAGDDGFLQTVNFNAWYKSLLGYLPANRVQNVTASGTYRIFGLESIIGSGLHALKMRKDNDRDYWVEFRPRISHNANSFNGANIHFGFRRIGQNSELLDMTPGSQRGFQDAGLAIGKTFSDNEAQIHITPIAKGNTVPPSLDVVVNTGNFATNRAPTVAVVVDKAAPGQGEVVTFTATATDPDNDTIAYHWDFGTTASSINRATISQNFPQASTTYTVNCTVTDMKGGTGTASVTINVGAEFVGGAPTVIAITPSSGLATGRTTVLISGTNFLAGLPTTVTFGGNAATAITVLNSTTLSCVSPAGTAGPVDVVVTHNEMPAGTLTGAFTYIGAPTIAQITPTSGGLKEDTQVTVTGTNFIAGETSFRFGLLTASDVTVISSTTATCTTPNATAGGAVDVSVAVGIPTAALTNAFTYISGPAITALSVTSGPTTGGTTLTITGVGFVAGATIKFGGIDATGVVVDSATQITCTTPARVAGAVELQVTSNGLVALRASAFTYLDVPTITTVTPNSGSTAGGAAVTLTGTGFAPGATVSVGGAAATGVVVRSGTELDFIAPAGAAGAANVIVTVSGAASAAATFTYVAPPTAPTLTMIDINTGPTTGGTNVAITGTDFVVGATTVTFGTAQATNVVVANSTMLTCASPVGNAGLVEVRAQVSGVGSTNALAFTYVGVDLPVVVAMAPDPVAAEPEPIPASQSNSQASTRASSVDNGTLRIQFNKPALVNTVITYSVIGAASSGIDYEALSGSATILAGNTFVDISVEPLNDKGDEGAEDVTIVIRSGAGFRVGATFTASVMIQAGDTPEITSVFPETGSAGGGEIVEIHGTNFEENNVVKFRGVEATETEVLSAELIVCRTPAGTAGIADVTVTQDTFVNTQVGAFLYVADPDADSIIPFKGPTSGGTPVTITGFNFAAGAEVEIGGAFCTNVVVVNATTIKCVTPSGIAGPQSVNVYINDIPAVLNQGFTFTDEAPKITSALAVTASKGAPFTYTITSNINPVKYEATNLPAGLTLAGATISGTPTVGGVARVTLKAIGGTGSDTQTLVISIAPGAGNTSPSLTSVLATPNPAVAGQAVQFTAAAVDAQGDLIDYSWNFGDGTPAVNGSAVSHVFAAAGIYTVTVTVTDSGSSESQSLNLAVNAGILADANRFSVLKASLKFTFPAGGKDGLSISGNIPVLSSFVFDQKTVVVAIGEYKQTLKLNSKGQFNDQNVSFKLSKPKKGVSGYKLTVKNTDLFAKLKSLGFTDQEIEAPGITVTLPVVLSLESSSYRTTRTVTYTVKKGKGSAK